MSTLSQDKFTHFINNCLTENEKDLAYICANFEFAFQTIGEFEIGLYIAPYNLTVLSVVWELLDKYDWCRYLTSHYDKKTIKKLEKIVDLRLLEIKSFGMVD